MGKKKNLDYLLETDNPGRHGYAGDVRRPPFTLAPHHYALHVSAWHPLGRYQEERTEGFKLLRDPQGNPIARRHADLRPGEVSLPLR